MDPEHEDHEPPDAAGSESTAGWRPGAPDQDSVPDDLPASESADAALHGALDDLERLLDRDGSRQSGPGPADDLPTVAPDGQYSIPLLQDVVVPGEIPAAPRRLSEDTPDGALADPELCRRLAERLASEAEVILHARMEEALGEAMTDVRRRLRDHIRIVLPELLDEILRQRREG